jgi:hypothetical protein
MMTPELYVFLFAALGVYTTASVWFRTAEERRIQQELARGRSDESPKGVAR